jgi:hypothetical protein
MGGFGWDFGTVKAPSAAQQQIGTVRPSSNLASSFNSKVSIQASSGKGSQPIASHGVASQQQPEDHISATKGLPTRPEIQALLSRVFESMKENSDPIALEKLRRAFQEANNLDSRIVENFVKSVSLHNGSVTKDFEP